MNIRMYTCVCVCGYVVCVIFRGTWLCNFDSSNERLFQVISPLSPPQYIAMWLLNLLNTISPYSRILSVRSFYISVWVTKTIYVFGLVGAEHTRVQ